MAERLEQFEKLNVDRIIYEKSKTEAIIESLEDGIVLIDPAGVVTHINEVAAIILGSRAGRRRWAAPFNDLDSNHPHYMRVRAALRQRRQVHRESARVEVDLHVRGRDHTYVLKPVPLRQGDGESFGTILILQDITYLRDKDRARANLVATLSHELKTPLTSLALSAELLERDKRNLDPKQRELLATANEDIGRIRHLADDLLNLARGETGTISIRSITCRSRRADPRRDENLRPAGRAKGHRAQTRDRRFDMPQVVRRPGQALVGGLEPDCQRHALYSERWRDHDLRAEHDGDDGALKVSDTGPGRRAGNPRSPVRALRAMERQRRRSPARPGSGWRSPRRSSRRTADASSSKVRSAQGTCFTVEIAAAQDERMAKLLIVDDEKNIRANLATFFEGCGHQVKTAESGAAGARSARATSPAST